VYYELNNARSLGEKILGDLPIGKYIEMDKVGMYVVFISGVSPRVEQRLQSL